MKEYVLFYRSVNSYNNVCYVCNLAQILGNIETVFPVSLEEEEKILKLLFGDNSFTYGTSHDALF